jgi:hypothetical protein
MDLNLAIIRALPTSDCYLHVDHVIILDFKVVMSLSKLIALGSPTPRYLTASNFFFVLFFGANCLAKDV